MALATALVLGGCGVPEQSRPTVLPVGASAFGSPASPSPTGAAKQPNATVFLVHGPNLVPVRRHLRTPVRVEAVIEAIAAGPDATEQGSGLRTALLVPLPVDSVVIDRSGNVTVRLANELAETGAAEQVLAFGQVVLSVTSIAGIHSVLFTVSGQPLSVPGGDGSISTQPLTRSDYQDLLGS